jgi:hypothetical protein
MSHARKRTALDVVPGLTRAPRTGHPCSLWSTRQRGRATSRCRPTPPMRSPSRLTKGTHGGLRAPRRRCCT